MEVHVHDNIDRLLNKLTYSQNFLNIFHIFMQGTTYVAATSGPPRTTYVVVSGPPYRWSLRTIYVAVSSPPGLLVLPQVVPL
jgi:hypothetical protein